MRKLPFLNIGGLTNINYWNRLWSKSDPIKPISILIVNHLNIIRLLKKHVRFGDRYIEIGCAPGKFLAWAQKKFQLNAEGLDYSDVGINQCKRLFVNNDLFIPLHCVDFFNNSLPMGSFDCVTSFGLIEHFDDPILIVSKHIDLLKPGGLALITLPNYGGVYGKIQKWCDPENIAMHNLKIMNPSSLEQLVNSASVTHIKAYYYGSVDPLILSLERKMPILLVKVINLLLNSFGLVQPFVISKLAPMLVLEVKK